KTSPAVQRRFDSLHDARVAVAKDQWSPGADVIEVPIAVQIEEVRPVPALDERRLTAYCAERAGRAIHAARNDSAGSPESLLAAVTSGFHALIIPVGHPSAAREMPL